MDDPTLTRLLTLVDEPAPDPEEFKGSLRHDLQRTLDRGSDVGRGSADTTQLRFTSEPDGRSARRWVLPLAAAACLVLFLGGLAFLSDRGGGDDPTRSSRPVPTAAVPAPTQPPAPTVRSLCLTYAATAEPFGALEAFAALAGSSTAPGAEDAPDLTSTAAALMRLGDELVTAELVEESTAVTLRLAAGGLSQAAAQLDVGDGAAAAGSVGFAVENLRELGDPPDPVSLPGCGFPAQ